MSADNALLLQVSADVSSLEKQMKKALAAVDSGSSGMETRAKKAAVEIEKSFAGLNVGEALEKTFAKAKLASLEEGGARIGVFGSALEALGPAGIAAGAGLFALAEGGEKVKQALEFTEDLEKTAATLGISTSKLQEFDFAALKAGISTDTFREGLKQGNAVFGTFISNVGDGKAKAAFAAIGITKEQARSFGDLGDALPTIADKIKGLGNASEQAQIAKKLGLEELLPALQKGGDYLRDSATEAQELGLVIDRDMVTRGAKFAEQMKITSDVIDHDMKRAFIDLAPVIQTVLGLVAKMARFIADSVENFKHLTGYHPEDASTAHLKENKAGAEAILSGKTFSLNPGLARDQLAATNAELAKRKAADDAEDKRLAAAGRPALGPASRKRRLASRAITRRTRRRRRARTPMTRWPTPTSAAPTPRKPSLRRGPPSPTISTRRPRSSPSRSSLPRRRSTRPTRRRSLTSSTRRSSAKS